MAVCNECKFFVPCTPEACWEYVEGCGHCHVAPPRTIVLLLAKMGTYGSRTRCGYPHLSGEEPECAESKPIEP